jgi:hypothetical protein
MRNCFETVVAGLSVCNKAILMVYQTCSCTVGKMRWHAAPLFVQQSARGVTMASGSDRAPQSRNACAVQLLDPKIRKRYIEPLPYM